MAPLPSYDSVRDDFAFLDNWEDRYRYVIELGRALPPIGETMRVEPYEGMGTGRPVHGDRRDRARHVRERLVVDGLGAEAVRIRGGDDRRAAEVSFEPRQRKCVMTGCGGSRCR